MKKTFHIAKANIARNKKASASLFLILMIASMLTTIGLSALLGVDQDFEAGVERLNSAHSTFVMTKELYNPSFEEVIRTDDRVSQVEIAEVLSPSSVTVNYGGEIDVRAIIFDLDDLIAISPPGMVEEDLAIPRDNAIYLPVYAKSFYESGDTFTITYKNKPIQLTVAGFFETNDFATINTGMLKFFVPDECYEMLKEQLGSAVWMGVRFFDSNDSPQFNLDFASRIDVELADFSFRSDADEMALSVIFSVSLIAAVLVIFALLVAVVSLFVIRFRVMSNIENTMHEIGVLKASGYTSAQIIGCYVMEYGIISIPAVLLGVFLSVPVFPLIRQAMVSTSGFSWSLGVNIPAGLMAALFIVAVLLVMVMRSCRKIKQLAPVSALRGGLATNSVRRNFFPLHKGAGKVHTRLGLKNIFVFIKTYVMTGAVMAVLSMAIIFVAVLYQNLVMDQASFAKMAGTEFGDAIVRVTRHTDVDTFTAELEALPEVRKTSMLDGMTGDILLEIDDVMATGYVSNDYSQMEILHTHDGRLPQNGNEIAIPKILADQLGKGIGDRVVVKASGTAQEYTITGFFSTVSNGGKVGALTLEGYQRLVANYKRGTVTVYLNEGAAYDEFKQTLEQKYGVLNIFTQDESGEFSGAKAVAEEKISNYLEMYDIDSVEYAVIYNDEIILSGSSGAYQIEKIISSSELTKANLGSYLGIVALIVSIIIILSLIIVSMIISMTMRSIVTKRHREIGTLKALGFTTNQIARQLAISFVPFAVIGIVAGCAAGAFLASPVLTSLLASTGAYGSIFVTSPLMVFIAGALFFLAAFTVANLSARKIKDISAYELIADGPVAKKKNKKLSMKKVLSVFVLCLILFPTKMQAANADKLPAPAEPVVMQAQSEQIYGVGSVSKVFTAAAVMKLAEEGKVELDTSITAYIPDFEMADERYTEITPRMLLNHSSGLMGTTQNNAWLLEDNDTYNHDHFLDLLKEQMLKHDPGERSIYCNDGFTLAEILIERVSGVGFTEFIEVNFSIPLGIETIETPQSDFDRSRLANIYMGNNELKPENFGLIGSGGIYATMEDLCRFATIFMDSAGGEVLSRESTDEMAKNQHRNEMVSSSADTVFRYGLGWDCVDTYPFSQYGIKALSKGGQTGMYNTNLTVLPEYNLAAAVSSSGTESQEQLIAQEILIAVLKEEGNLPEDTAVTVPMQNLAGAMVPEDVKANAGIYEAGIMGHFSVEFTDDSLIITPIMVRNERSQEYRYTTDGRFVSTNGDFIGMNAATEGARGTTAIQFAGNRYLVIQTYETLPGLGTTAYALPLAEKLESNGVPSEAVEAWEARNGKEYLLVSEKYTSMLYLKYHIAETLTDDRAYGYVAMGIYQGSGKPIKMAKIVDENTAVGFQSTPTVTGRDTNDLFITKQNGFEYLAINNFLYIDAAAAKKYSEIGGTVVMGAETIWVDLDSGAGGQTISIATPQNGAWFVYDDKMNCIASSLEAQLRSVIILPEGGRLAFAGEAGATFELK